MPETHELPPLKELSFELPLVIDSTKLTTFRLCPYKFFLQYMNHIRGGGETPIALHAGGVFATGLEAFRKHAYSHHHLPDPAFEFAVQAMMLKWGDYEPPSNDTRTFDRVCNAVKAYFKRWPTHKDPIRPIVHGPNDDPSFEYSFAYELSPDEGFPLHPSGEPFILTGRGDLLGDLVDENYKPMFPVIQDDKTTTRLGPTWSDQWHFRHQFMLYLWVLRKLGYDQRYVVVRGVCFRKYDVDLIETPPIHYPNHVLDKFEEELRDTLWHMVRISKTLKYPRNFGNACMSFFRPCEFTNLCSATPENELRFMKTLPREEWDPLGADQTISLVPREEGKWRNTYKDKKPTAPQMEPIDLDDL